MAAVTVVLSASSLREDQVEQLRHKFSQIEFAVPSNDAAYAAFIPNAHVVVGGFRQEFLPQAGNLQWIQSTGAGVDRLLTPELIASDVIVTNAQSLHAMQISEHVLAMMLALARDFQQIFLAQREHVWRPPVFHPFCLEGQTLGVVGVGGIGGETARLCAGFGMTVLGVDPRLPEPTEGVAELHRPEALLEVLPRADFVLVTVPETPETQGMFAWTQFEAMKETAFFINIGRGATTVLDDLVEALRAGEIAGAGLDVFQVEPLPEGHPLWTTPGVLITPHVAGVGPYLDDRRTELFVDNCKRFDEGRPLRNLVDEANWF